MNKLFKLIPTVLHLLPNQFTTHKLIKILAQKYQREYIDALSEHKRSKRPFGTVHSKIGKHLKKANYVRFIRADEVDEDIFGQRSEDALWEKFI